MTFSYSVVNYKEALNIACSDYLSTVINKAKCKTLFSEINKLVKPSSVAITGPVDLCESFQSFFLQIYIFLQLQPPIQPHL